MWSKRFLLAANHTTIFRNYFWLTAEIVSYIVMRILKLRSCGLILLLAFCLQSLVDVAREEAERRRRLEEQGITAKVFDGIAAPPAPNGNITTSTVAGTGQKETPVRDNSAKGQPSLRGFRSALQKLDRSIQQTESRLAATSARLQDEKWSIPKSGKASGRGGTKDLKSRLQAEIDELQAKLKQLQDERLEVYSAGKKAGFLPGELDGKGLIP